MIEREDTLFQSTAVDLQFPDDYEYTAVEIGFDFYFTIVDINEEKNIVPVLEEEYKEYL